MSKQKLIGVRTISPLEKRDKAYALEYYCDTHDCPLLAKGQCINVVFLSSCVYGKVSRTNGYTSRARKYTTFLNQWREKAVEYPILSPDRKEITKIGDYFWLPYSFINHESAKKLGIQFVGYSGAFRFGSKSFVPADSFTPEVIVKLVNMRPQALFGGEITDYRKQSVPKFLNDLQRLYPDIFNEAVELEPKIKDIASKGSAIAVKLQWLYDRNLGGKATIRDRECYVFKSTKSVEVKDVEVTGFEDAESAEASMKLPGNITVWPDTNSSRYMKLRSLAEKDGAIVFTK